MKLSIITINYNNAEGLMKTIKSITSQTFIEFQYIVIDGGSTDGSADIIKENNQHITYWVSEKDKGIYHAMNKGLDRAVGDYIMFLNSGDTLYDKNILGKIIPFLDNKVDILYGSFVIVYPDGSRKEVTNNKEMSFLSFLGRERHFCHQSVFMSRKSIEKAGGAFDETLKILADWKMLSIALIKRDAELKYVDQIICNYDGNGLSMQLSSSSLVQKEYKEILLKEFPLFYNDVERLRKMGSSFPELFNSKYVRFFLKIKHKIHHLF